MTKEEAIKVIRDLKLGAGLSGDDTAIDALEFVENYFLEKGCANCKYEAVEPWESPCCRCSHNHKDYYTEK